MGMKLRNDACAVRFQIVRPQFGGVFSWKDSLGFKPVKAPKRFQADLSAGVIGLSTAVRLQQDGYNVAIVAKDFPSPFETIDAKASINYTSQWGGAHNRWVIPANETEERDHAKALVTFQQMESLNKSNPEAGISFMPGIEYLEDPPAQYSSLTESKAKSLGLVEFRRLKPSEFPDDKVKWG
ncbi:hypothetical protein CTA2_4898 [Colletotrichum tanaceti]|uniref:D-amino-acid oxidase n=1 Tax=Colletotrichum tanaceti TaxID=1306861 RepID=A0A4V6DI89_9PEZI|nr:hypothetical protein CTA2_4898 [Colletotrichum tanaceti]TKW59486.1 hypothetical protein CTA1_4182 [Colletotrichum tanaceti]